MSPRSGGGEGSKACGRGASNQVRVEDREGGGAPGPGPGGRRKRAGSCLEVGVCIWVCPGCRWGGGRPSRGPEGGAHEGAGPAAQPGPGPSGWKVSGCLEAGWREVAERPRSRLRRRPGEAAPVQGRGTAVRGPSPVKEQHLPPGVEMGRNGPEHRPGSETPHPLPRSGRRAGRKSLTLTPPPFPLPSAFRPSRPLPSLPLLLSS